MWLIKEIAIGIGSFIVVVVFVFVVIVGLCLALVNGPDLCGNHLITETVSPNQAMKAVIFERDCGATTRFSTHVAILDTSASLKDAGQSLFVADTNRGNAPAGPGGGPEIRLRWLSDSSLEIQHHRLARVIREDSKFKSVKVTYDTFQ